MLKKVCILFFLSIITFNSQALNDKSNLQLQKNYEIFYELFKTLDIYYVDSLKYGEMLDKGLNAMLSTLDPYTNYIPEKDVESFDFQITGKYGGIGSIIRKIDSNVVIIEPYEGSPAQRFGLLPGDKILSINGENVTGLPVNKVTGKLKGDPGEKLKILIQRYATKDSIIINLVREKIFVPSVPYYGFVKDSKTGYIQLTSFRSNCADTIASALRNLKKLGAESIILDLRNNGGGLLNEAIKICNVFLPRGSHVLSTRGKLKLMNTTYTTQFEPVDTLIPLAILINSGSASASEIVSGTMQDYDRAVIMGKRSFGKGLVQTPKNLPYNTKVKFTTAKYYIHSGRCIQVLDYTHRNKDGSVGKIPDSLKTAFKTNSGRTVYDGGGVNPDIEIKPRKIHDITIGIYAEDMVFNYSNMFFNEHKSITKAEDYLISDDEYANFRKFLKKEKFVFKSKTQQSLKSLKTDLESDSIEASKYTKAYDILNSVVENLKNEKLVEYKDEIKEFLEQEIIGRYYYQKGKIISRLKYDDIVFKAVKLLENKNKYKSSLLPKKEDKLKKVVNK